MATKREQMHGRVEGAADALRRARLRRAGRVSRAARRPGNFDGPGSWRYLCLDHVREHNARYNYFVGMSPEEIAAAQSPIAGWERSTRAFATAGADRGPAWSDFADPLDAIAARFRPGDGGAAVDRFTAAERHALGRARA